MEPLNLKCFSQPHWKVIARGFDVERWFDDGQAVGTGGILMPKERDLPVGQRYFRFTSSTSSRDAQIGGGWWVDFENFEKIRRFSDDYGYNLRSAARLFLALPYEWTRADRLVSAFLEVPLCAYYGRGKVASANGENWTPTQHIHVEQLYIPGLYRRGARKQLYAMAFPKPKEDFSATLSTRRK